MRQFNDYGSPCATASAIAYGLAMANENGVNGEYNNRYTSKELQTDEFVTGEGLEMYDFDARFYDPQLGRWFAPDPARQLSNPYLAMGNNPVMYVDPDGGEIITAAIIIGAAIGAYIGGLTANDGDMNPGNWNWQSGHTWAGMGIGAVVGGLGGYGFAIAGPAMAGRIAGVLPVGGAAAGYAITGGVAMGLAGYGAGIGSAMARGKGNWNYGHQAGMFGMKVGGSIGSFAGGIYGLAQGVDYSMPEYQEPSGLEWNKSYTASTGSGLSNMQDDPSPDDLRKIYSRSYQEFQNMIHNNTIGYSTNSGTEFPSWLYSNASLYPDPMYLSLAPQLDGINAVINTIVYRLGSSINLSGNSLLQIGPNPTWSDVYPYFTYPDYSNYFDGAIYYQMKLQWVIPNLLSFRNHP